MRLPPLRRTLKKIARVFRRQRPETKLSWFSVSGLATPPAQPSNSLPRPGVVRQADCLTPDFFYWIDQLRGVPTLWRKNWEWFLGLHTLYATKGPDWRGLKAIGFGVGIEPIPDLLASRGVSVLATDWREGAEAQQWGATSQLSHGLEDLHQRSISSDADFSRFVSYADVDMNAIPHTLDGQFDFVFSFCSLGHIGGYQKGLDFIVRSASLLAPGGVAVHTTEWDLSQGKPILDSPALSFYRMTDLEGTLQRLREAGYLVPEHDFTVGPGFADQHVDTEPYTNTHLRVDVLGYDVITVGLVFFRP